MSNSLGPHGLSSSRLLCPWDSPGKNTGVGSHSLLKGIFPTQGWNPGLLHSRKILYCLNHPRSNGGAGPQREIFTVLRLAGQEITQLGVEVMVGICQGFRGWGWVGDTLNRENSICKAMEIWNRSCFETSFEKSNPFWLFSDSRGDPCMMSDQDGLGKMIAKEMDQGYGQQRVGEGFENKEPCPLCILGQSLWQPRARWSGTVAVGWEEGPESDTGRTLSGDEGIRMMSSVTAGRAGGSEAVGNGESWWAGMRKVRKQQVSNGSKEKLQLSAGEGRRYSSRWHHWASLLSSNLSAFQSLWWFPWTHFVFSSSLGQIRRAVTGPCSCKTLIVGGGVNL